MFGRIMIFAAALCGALSASATAPTTSVRDVRVMDSGWTFFVGTATSTDGAAVVDLPHTWNAMGNERGVGNYLKLVDVPAEWADRRVFLRVGGAATVADVFVGSHHVGSHKGGSSAFTVELTGALKFGSANALRIVVDNSPRLDVMPTAGAENIYGGLFRGVELIVCDPSGLAPDDGVRVETGVVDTQRVDGRVRLRLLGTDTLPTLVRVRFQDGEGKQVFERSAPVEPEVEELAMEFSLPRPRLWNGTEDPHLYDVEVVVRRADTLTLDSVVVRTGFRTVAVSDRNKILLNDRQVPVRGVIVHRDRAMVGAALTHFQIEEDVALIRETGANAVRVAGGQHSDYFYELCDEAGLLVWSDLPFTGAAYPTDLDFVDTPAFRNNGAAQLTEMIDQLDHHPSVVVWGLFSDILVRPDNDPVPFVRELDALAHDMDPERLTGGVSVQDGELNAITDLIVFDLPFGWESGPPDGVKVWLEQLRRNFPNLHAGISYSAGGSIFQKSRTLQKPDIQSTSHPESWQTFVHREYLRLAADAPELWGVFVGNMFDFGSWRALGGHGRGIDDHGLVTFDRKYRKEAFDVYRAAWNPDKK